MERERRANERWHLGVLSLVNRFRSNRKMKTPLFTHLFFCLFGLFASIEPSSIAIMALLILLFSISNQKSWLTFIHFLLYSFSYLLNWTQSISIPYAYVINMSMMMKIEIVYCLNCRHLKVYCLFLSYTWGNSATDWIYSFKVIALFSCQK